MSFIQCVCQHRVVTQDRQWAGTGCRLRALTSRGDGPSDDVRSQMDEDAAEA